jgi:hypothetical protein
MVHQYQKPTISGGAELGKTVGFEDGWEYDEIQSTFSYIPMTEATIFHGSSKDTMQEQCVWVVNLQLGNFVPES